MPIMTTAIYAAFNATFSIILAVMVSAKRAKTNVFLGTGSPELFLAMRRHGNNAEYVALGLVVLLICELSGGRAWALQAIGLAFTLGRVLHAIGVGPNASLPRGFGALLSWIAIAGGSIYGAILVIK